MSRLCYHIFLTVCILLCVTNIRQGKVFVITTKVVIQSVNTQMEFFYFPTAKCLMMVP
jgi:hypothetical protein